MKFVVYRVPDGKILRTGGASSPSLMRLQAQEGEAVMAVTGYVNTREHVVTGGRIVALAKQNVPVHENDRARGAASDLGAGDMQPSRRDAAGEGNGG